MSEAAETMVRTQVQLSPSQLKRGRRLAAEEGISFAELVRRALDAYPPGLQPEDGEALDALARAVLRSKHEADEAMTRAIARPDELERNVEERRHGHS